MTPESCGTQDKLGQPTRFVLFVTHVRCMHLSPKWWPFYYSFTAMLISPLGLVGMCKIQKNFQTKNGVNRDNQHAF